MRTIEGPQRGSWGGGSLPRKSRPAANKHVVTDLVASHAAVLRALLKQKEAAQKAAEAAAAASKAATTSAE